MLLAATVHAHDARPIFVEIIQTSSNTYESSWKVPASMPAAALPAPRFPDYCDQVRPWRWQQTSAGYQASQTLRCHKGLAGGRIGIHFPVLNPSLTTLFSLTLLDDSSHLKVLKPGEADWIVPEAPKRFAVATQYTGLGIRHIWAGIDHLLFVGCLVLIAGTFRRLVITITGFTLAHSITLIASTLNWITLPTPPVEAVIALSVVFLAWEIAREVPDSLTRRYPVAVAATFGLLHGFGFASVLREIGLPGSEIPTALLFFNLGVEAGQLLFVVTLAVAYAGLKPLLRPSLPPVADTGIWSLHRAVALPACYVIGSLASYWLFLRLAGFWA